MITFRTTPSRPWPSTRRRLTDKPSQIRHPIHRSISPTRSSRARWSVRSRFSNDLRFLDATIQQWNFNIHREVVKSLVVDLTYVGSLATHLDDNASLNAALPGPGPFPPRRPYPNERVVVS